MTADDLTARALSLASPKAGEPQLAKEAAELLPFIMPIFLAWLLTKLLDMLWNHFVKGHKFALAIVRSLGVRPAIRRVEQEKGVRLADGDRRQLEEQIINGAQAAARGLTAGELAELREEAKGQ